MGVKYSSVIERMRWAGRLKNDSAVAKVVDVTPQALSNYKKRGQMPTDLVLKFASIYSLSIDWLVTGKGSMFLPGSDRSIDNMGLAAEDESSYGIEEGESAPLSMSPDQIIYIGKLLKIINSGNKTAITAVKCSIDAFLNAIENEPQGDEEKGGEEQAGDDLVQGS